MTTDPPDQWQTVSGDIPPALPRAAGDSNGEGPSFDHSTEVDDGTNSTLSGEAYPALPTPAMPGYEILSELGRGGMGVVYLARDLRLKRVVALKTILAGAFAGSAALARFRTEAEVIARLQHPNIVQIFEVGTYANLPFFALEYCSSGSLAHRLKQGPMQPAAAAALTETLANAVHAAHLSGVVHRDLKPENILLTADDIPKITDFGLAKRSGDTEALTQSGALLGTPGYMAPEQASGHSEAVGCAADIYGLGAILYKLLVGRPPFQAASAMDTLQQVVWNDPVPIRWLDPSIPRDLETICMKCLEKQASSRYLTARELADDLRRFLESRPVLAKPASAFERLIKFAIRNPVTAIVACMLLSVGSVVVRTILSLDESVRRTFFDVMNRLALNSAHTTFALILVVGLFGAVFHRRHRSRLMETVWRCIFIWLILKLSINLLIPFIE